MGSFSLMKKRDDYDYAVEDRVWLERIIKIMNKNFQIEIKKSQRVILVMKKKQNGRTLYALAEVLKNHEGITHQTHLDHFSDKDLLVTEIMTRAVQITRGDKNGKNKAKRSKMYAVQ